MFLPGESQGRGSLVGCCLWGHTVKHYWSDLAAAAANAKHSSRNKTPFFVKGWERIGLNPYLDQKKQVTFLQDLPFTWNIGNSRCFIVSWGWVPIFGFLHIGWVFFYSSLVCAWKKLPEAAFTSELSIFMLHRGLKSDAVFHANVKNKFSVKTPFHHLQSLISNILKE